MASHLVLEESDALHLTRDARIVAIRWDLIEWGLVLDLDVPVSESAGAPMRRAWIVFNGVADVTIPMADARLPNGIWLTSALGVAPAQSGFRGYSCQALFPNFEGNERAAADAHSGMFIRAQSLVGVISTDSGNPSESMLSYEVRNRLSSDLSMLEAIANLAN